MDKSLGLAELALAHKLPEKKEAPKVAKKVKEMHIRRAHNGGHIIKHMHEEPYAAPEHDEEHVTADNDGLVDHVMQHMGNPDSSEPEAEAMGA